MAIECNECDFYETGWEEKYKVAYRKCNNLEQENINSDEFAKIFCNHNINCILLKP